MRVLGVDDGCFRGLRWVPMAAVLMRGKLIEGVSVRKIRVHGRDATEKILDILLKSKFSGQAKAVMSNGVALGGTNTIDFEKLLDAGVGFISVTRKKPSERFKDVLRAKGKIDAIEKINKLNSFHEKVYVQYFGLSEEDARKLVKAYQIHAIIPEPIRVAHLFATAMTLGDSRGYA